MLSLNDALVNFTDAKATDGTILQSPTFDLGETVDVVSEDGTKTPAANGEYQISLRDTEGKETMIRVVVQDGKINERENVEEAQPEAEPTEMADVDADMVKTQKLPSTGNEDAENVMPEVKNSVTDGTLKMEETTLPVGPLPQTEEAPNQAGEQMNLETLAKTCMELAYRISEMEKALKMGDVMTPPVDSIVTEEESGTMMKSVEEDEELPKLDGAPVEDAEKIHRFNSNRKNYGEKMVDPQSSFLSKLYK